MSSELAPSPDPWERFAAWEAERLRATPADLTATLAWLAAAWELAEHRDPEWGSVDRAMGHWRRCALIQRRLARARGCPAPADPAQG